MNGNAFKLSKRLALPAVAVNKLLFRSKRRVVKLAGSLNQIKAVSKFIVQAIWIVPDNVEAATAQGAFEAKRSDNEMSASLYRESHSFDITRTIFDTGEKVKHGAVMPNVIEVFRQVGAEDACFSPGYLRSELPKSLLCYLKRGPRNIQDSDILVPMSKQIIHQG